jgi:TIR domain-containing protein
MSSTAKKVFLSYARADVEPARKVADHLREAGIPVWDPEVEILPGSDWPSALKKALDSALAMVVFISPEAIESRSVSREIEYALGAKHLRGRLIPVILRPAKDAPWILDSLQPVRYDSPDRTGKRIVKLLSQPVHVPQARRSA